MDVVGTLSGKVYRAGSLVASAGEGSVYRVVGDRSLLLKTFARPLTTRQIDKLRLLSGLKPKPSHAALPVELLVDPATQTPVGYVQPFFADAIPLSRILDSYGRTDAKLPDDLGFRVKLCRLVAEAFVRIHATNLVVGDVSDGNFLLGIDWFGRANVVYSIDCNSFQVTRRTNRGNDYFPSGVATEEYAAPEVQPTDWAMSLRSVYSDSFGFAVLAWKLIFSGAHPFAVITPRSVDVPPLGQRIEQRLFPFCPGSMLPGNWKAPPIQPSLAVLPVEVRELFFRTFSAADPRDRPTLDQWSKTFRSWEIALTPSLPFRVLGAWNGSVADRLAETISTYRPYLGRGLVLASLTALAVLTSQVDFTKPQPPSEPVNSRQHMWLDLTDKVPRPPRFVDRELFPEPFWNPSQPLQE